MTDGLARIFPRVGIAAVIVVGLLAAMLTGGGSTVAAPGRANYTIAIANFTQHPILDDILRGMRSQLASEGFTEGKNVTFINQNANGQIQLATTIARDLVSRKPDVIVALTTPMTQAVVKVARPAGVPVVFATVVDPVGAGIVKSLDVGEPNVTGASDAWPYEAQMKLIRKITPRVNRLGVLFNPGEAASQFGIRQIRKFAKKLGFTLVEGSVGSTNEVYPVARGLIGRVDALYLSSDNTVIPGAAGAVQVAIQKKIPLYVGDSGTVEKGGLATVSVGYYALGKDTGRLVSRFLRGNRTIPTIVEQGSDISVNTKAAHLMGVTVPSEILRRAKHVYTTIH